VLSGAARQQECRSEVWARPRAGVCMHFSSLPGPCGIGDIGRAARAFIDLMGAAGLDVWQFLPTGPTAYGDSPYQPLSAFAGNPLLIDVEALVDRGWLDADELEPLRALSPESVRYEQLIPLKLGLVERAAQRFLVRAPASEQALVDRFVTEQRPVWLADYALFEVLKRRHQLRSWHLWEREYVLREPAALQRIREDAADEIRRIEIIQYFFDAQWQSLRTYASDRGVFLFGDVPIYMAADCAEAWSQQALLQLDHEGLPEAVAGVPPDYFSAEGQWWGNPLYRWEAHAAQGFSWWIARMRHAMQQFDLVRLDHFRGFDSYWSIPADAKSAREGRWLTGPGRALFDAVQAALGTLTIVAEDLGIITPAVEQLRDDYGFPGMQVLQFLLEEPDFALDRIPQNCVCYTGTHDNDTSIGWLTNAPLGHNDPQQRKNEILQRIGGPEADLSTALIELACRSRAQLVIAPMQDFLGLDSSARMNTPGRAENNWRWRMLPEQASAGFCDWLRAILVRSGRA
jgi:4-alpha-glucanotransferase